VTITVLAPSFEGRQSNSNDTTIWDMSAETDDGIGVSVWMYAMHGRKTTDGTLRGVNCVLWSDLEETSFLIRVNGDHPVSTQGWDGDEIEELDTWTMIPGAPTHDNTELHHAGTSIKFTTDTEWPGCVIADITTDTPDKLEIGLSCRGYRIGNSGYKKAQRDLAAAKNGYTK
jgi:hypothetical protein